MALISKIYNSSQYMHEAEKGWSKKNKLPKNAPASAYRQRPIMIWVPQRARFEVYESYDIRESLKSAGFRFDPKLKCWWAAKPKTAVRAIKYADPEAKEMLIYFLSA